VDTNPSSGGTLGQNIALGFYCDNSVTTTSCSGNGPANTYYFAKNQPGYQNHCVDDDSLLQKLAAQGTNVDKVGCRDATVILWELPQWAQNINQGGSGWQNNGGGGPDRIRVARLLNFRIYCERPDSNLNSACTLPPKSVVGSAANSTVWGRFVSPAVTGSCPTCSGGPSLNGNSATLES
jgi:hypothetical protein